MILNATFENLALLGLLLAGFGGVAQALQGGAPERADAPASPGGVLGTAFGVVFFAYLPHVLYTLSGVEALSWRAAHALFALWHLGIALRFLPVARGLLAGGLVSKIAGAAIPLAGLAVLAGQAAGALGALPAAGYLLYLVALLWQLLLASVRFALLLTKRP